MGLLVFDELRLVLFSQASEHESEHAEIDHGLATTGQILIILAQAARTANPSDSTLHDPTARQVFKGFGQAHLHKPLVLSHDPATTRGTLDDFDRPAHFGLNPRFALSCIALIHPY